MDVQYDRVVAMSEKTVGGESSARFTGADDDDTCGCRSHSLRPRCEAVLFLILNFDLRMKIYLDPCGSSDVTLSHHHLIGGVSLKILTTSGAQSRVHC